MYPHGPARNPTSIQRGSVQFLSSYPGDPTTPGYPAYENSTRTEGENIPKIPSLPVSWANAQRLLKEIGEVEVVNKDGQVELTGKSSKNFVRLVNHGMSSPTDRISTLTGRQLTQRSLPFGTLWHLSLAISKTKLSLLDAIGMVRALRLAFEFLLTASSVGHGGSRPH